MGHERGRLGAGGDPLMIRLKSVYQTKNGKELELHLLGMSFVKKHRKKGLSKILDPTYVVIK